MAKTDEVQRAATGARTALAVLRCELPNPSGDTAKALGIVERLVEEAEAGRDPLTLQDDWPERALWPSLPHWDCWAWAIKTLANAGDARARCSQKHGYMRVDVGRARNNDLTMALAELGDLIERASDTED